MVYSPLCCVRLRAPGIQTRIPGRLFLATQVFPSSHQIQYVRSTLDPISSEAGLQNMARDTVENAVQKLIDEVYRDSDLRVRLNLEGSVTFESHTNLGPSQDES